MRKLLLAIILLFTISTNLIAQQVMMQGWYWDYPKTAAGFSWADTLRLKAASLKQAGITHMWFPPHAVASFGPGSNGYDPKDLFIGNQTTGLATRPNLNAMLAEFNSQGIAPVADVIFNHRDGGAVETNPAVKSYITNFYNASKEPFPSDRYRCILPVGGSTGNGAGDYYFKLSSKSGDGRFNNFQYKLYMQTTARGFAGLAAQTEVEPNGGGDCGQANNLVTLGRDMIVNVETTGSCNTDEFHLVLAAGDFNAAGDTIQIYLNNTGGYSDHRIYGLYSTSTNSDIASQVLYQTYTDYSNMPSGRGQMNFEFFKPNTANASTTTLGGDWDGMFFFYDYDQFQKRTKDTLINYAKWNWTDLGVRGFRMDAVKHFTPEFVGDLLDSMHTAGMNPSMVVGEWYSTNAGELSGWINNVKAAMDPATQAAIQPKIFDFSLRENLRQACDDAAFDVRNVFTGSLHDASGLSGFNVVTFANNHDFRDGSGFASLIRNNPMLSYAYILTNNQLGVPTIFYPDYYGYPAPAGGLYGYHPTNIPAGKDELDRLIKVLQLYINNSPSADYLNRFSTPYAANFIEGSSNKALIYQMEGSASNSFKDVIVAINFGNTTLKVDQQINNRNGGILPGMRFTDVLGRSAYPFQVVDGSGRVYIELPAHSYSVWVQGTLTVLPLNVTQFSATAQKNAVTLGWTVSGNEMLSSFDIERSDDGVTYRTIGTKPAVTATGIQQYSFIDKNVVYNKSMLYRLEVHGKDGVATYSDIRMAKLASTHFEVALKTNPVKDKILFAVTSGEAQQLTVRIYSMTGALVSQQKITAQAGKSVVPVDIQQLSKAVYQCTVSNTSGEKTVLQFVHN